jgi:hypothetical protein
MGLRGSLSDVGPLEAIQMIALQNRTGRLTIRAGGTKHVFDFVDGQILATHPTQVTRRSHLVRLFEELNLLERGEIVHWLDSSRRATADPLDVLQGLGLVSDEDLYTTYDLYTNAVLAGLLRPQGGGRFHFHNSTKPRVVQCLDPNAADSLLLEGLRRRDEVDEIMNGPLSLDVVPVTMDEDQEEIVTSPMGMDERVTGAVRNLCDGRWRLDEILARTALPEYEVITTLARDVIEGQIRLVGTPAPLVKQMPTGGSWLGRAALPVLSLVGALGLAIGVRMMLGNIPAPSMSREIFFSPQGEAETTWRREEAAREGELLLQKLLSREEADPSKKTPGEKDR